MLVVMIDKYIQQLAEDLEIGETLTLESPGVYTIPLENDLSVKVSDLSPGILFYCTIASCPDANKENFLSQAMLANLFGQGTHDAVLGLNESGNMLTLSKEVNYTIDYKDFKDLLEDFINVVDFWREEAKIQNITK